MKDFSFTFLELPKFNKSIDELHTITEKWAYFFKYAEETHEDELAKLIGSDDVIKRAYDELNRFYWTPEELARYERETKNELDFIAIRDQNIADGIAKGEVIGIAKGEELATHKIAKNMLKSGIETDIIIENTGLTREELEKIRESL